MGWHVRHMTVECTSTGSPDATMQNGKALYYNYTKYVGLSQIIMLTLFWNTSLHVAYE